MAGRRQVVMDNGADRLKLGFGGESAPRFSIPNCTAKHKGQLQVLVGDEVELVRNTSNLQYMRPFDRGCLTNWDTEYKIWRRALGDTKLHVDPEEAQLVVTEFSLTPAPLSGMATQVIFEEFGFAGCCKLPATSLAAHGYRSQHSLKRKRTSASSSVDCVVVVDSGFSATHVVPYYRGRSIKPAIKRINVGGKLLTNLLKETVSYRQWNMMDEFQLVNDAKEALCYVSLDFDAEMARLRSRNAGGSRHAIRKNFVLPDLQTTMRGYVQPEGEALGAAAGQTETQVLTMEVERFAVPEILFRPSDIGLRQAGIPEAIHQAIQECDVGLKGALYSNVLVVGGNAKLSGFRDRVEKELRTLAPDVYDVHVEVPQDPAEYAWLGGSQLASDHHSLAPWLVTKAQYDEMGWEACESRVFAHW